MAAKRSSPGPRGKGLLGTVLALSCLVLGSTGCPVQDNPTPPSVEISPVEGLAGTTFPVQVRGTNTHFEANGFAAEIEGHGARVTGVRVSGETAARLEVTIDPGATAGPRTLRIDAPPDVFTAELQVRVPDEVPELQIAPNLGAPDTDPRLTLTGTATHFEEGVTTLMFPERAQIKVLSLQVANPTLAFAHVEIGEDPPEGSVVVAVVTRDELVYDQFRVVTSATPSVSVDPPEGFKDSAVDVVVSGSRADFGVQGDRVLVSFDPGAGIRVSDVSVTSRTRLTARFAVGANAQAGYQRFTVRVDPADPEQSSREFAGTFSVRGQGSPSVRILPPAVHRGEVVTLWLEGSGSAFDDLLGVRPEAGAGVDLTGLWVLGEVDAAIRLSIDPDASLGTCTIDVDDGAHDGLTAAIEVLEADPWRVSASPAFLPTGATDIPVPLTSPGGTFDGATTSLSAADRSGIAIRSLVVQDPTNATAVVAVQQTAPTGRTFLTVETSGVVSRAPVTVIPADDAGSIRLDPPVVRAGLGLVEVLATVENATLAAMSVAEISDPAIAVTDLQVNEESPVARLTLDVSRAAAAGLPTVVLADGARRLAAPLEVLPAAAPSVSTSPSVLEAGRAGQLVVAFGERTTWLPGVTVAAAPLAGGISVDGLSVVDQTTAVLEVTVSSEAPVGPTGIVLATHGEVSVAPLTITEPEVVWTLVLEPPSVEPGTSETITASIQGFDRDLRAGPVHAELPESPEIRLLRTVVVGEATLALDLEVDEAATAGTRPIEVTAPGLDVRAGLAVRVGGGPAVWIEPPVVAPGRSSPLRVRVDGLDLASGPVEATADSPDVLVGDVVGETTDRATVDVIVDEDTAIDAFWLRIAVGGEEALHRILVAAPPPLADTVTGVVEAGTAGTDVSVTGDQTSFAPEETLVLPGADSSGLRFGRPEVGSPEQLHIWVDASADIDVDMAQLIVVTGSEVVAANLPVRRSSVASFEVPGEAHGSVLPDLGAVLVFDGVADGLQRLRIWPDAPESEMSLALVGPEGFAQLAPAVRSTSPIVYSMPAGAFAHVRYAGEPFAGGDPLGFSFEARPLVADAAAELEPNDTFEEAELFPDPVLSPTVMTCLLGPTADRDTFVVTASSPVVFEVFAQRIIAGPAAPDIAIRAPLDAGLVAPDLGADLVAVLQPRGRAEAVALGLEGLAGSGGAYLVVARSAVVVNEIGWTAEGGYVELRAGPGLSLDGFAVRIMNAGGQALLPDIPLDGAVAGEQGILLLSPTELADVLVPALDLPDDGAVAVRWAGGQVDAVAFGAAVRVEGEPVDPGAAAAVGRRFGIDRNDNAMDFEPVPPSPGTE